MLLQDLWNGILELTAQLVIPDWGSVILLIPIAIVVLVAIVLIWTFRRLWTAPPPRRGKQRIEPRTPPGIHMPGPSFAPIFAGVGAFLTFLGLIYGGAILVLGLIALALTLLYWLAEAVRIYDRDVADHRPQLPAVVHEGPPPGVHMPGPSFRPFLGAIGTTMVLLGLIYGGWMLITGVIGLILTLFGWLVDARKEYQKVQEADVTGHLENIPAPKPPRLLLSVLALLFLSGVVLQAGILPPQPAAGVGSEVEAGEPNQEGEPDVSAPPIAEEGSQPPSPAADVVITAVNIAFEPTTFTAPADTPFTLALDNQDAGTPHNIELKDPGGASVFTGDIFNGVDTMVYDVPALPAGEYQFICSVHPNMTGTASLQ
ncbi:MAG TPA: cupredoxin domain-containing protein [Candidatus Limnocylindrales bacterium]|nr:cupredoxin domain-containing protein [Candidatus Limnocylindrales bacterium]